MSSKIEIDKTVFDTLIYFCFGFTLNEEADKIVEIIAYPTVQIPTNAIFVLIAQKK